MFPVLHKHENLSTTGKKLVERAVGKAWKSFFNSIRASAETDLMDDYGIRRACMWSGNSMATAAKNYALVKSTDFDLDNPSISPQKSNAITPENAKSNAVPASTEETGIPKTQIKNAPKRTEASPGCVSVGDTGLEPVTSTL